MNYKRIYDEIINRAKFRNNMEGYLESHHIIPKCMDGDNSKENLVDLTAREHFLAHWLLTEIYPEHKGLRYAFWMMCQVQNKGQLLRYKPSSRIYEYAKIRMGENWVGHQPWNKGKVDVYTAETKLKMSSSAKGRKASPETKKKFSDVRKGKKLSAHHVQRIKDGKQNVSQETKDKISQALKGNTNSKGRIYTESHKQKISESTKAKWKSGTRKENWNEQRREQAKGTFTGKLNPMSKSVEIDGIVYDTLSAAAKELNVHIVTISKRAKSSDLQFSNYKLVG